MKAPLLSPKVALKKLKLKRENGSRKSKAFTPAHSSHRSRINLEFFVTVDFSRRSTAFSQISSSANELYDAGVMAGRLNTKEAPPFGQRMATLRQRKGLTQGNWARA